jgi:Glycosyl hydrolase family 47
MAIEGKTRKSVRRGNHEQPSSSSRWIVVRKRTCSYNIAVALAVATSVVAVTISSLFNASRQIIYPAKSWYDSDNYVIKDCRDLNPTKPPDLGRLSPLRRERFHRAHRAIRHSYYCHYAPKGRADIWESSRDGGGSIPNVRASPISANGRLLPLWRSSAESLHESLDTLYLANMTTEYEQVLHLVTDHDVQTTYSSSSLMPTRTMDYSLKIVGGLLAAYGLSGDPRLFAAARNAADALLESSFETSPTTVLPAPFSVLAPPKSSSSSKSFVAIAMDWKAAVQRLWRRLYITFGRNCTTKIMGEDMTTTLEEVGSFGMEFSFLSTVSGDPKYRRASDAIFRHVRGYQRNGMVPARWNVRTGRPETNHTISLGFGDDGGGGSKSFYENLIKVPTLNRCRYDAGMEMYVDPCTGSDAHHLELFENMVEHSIRHVLDDVKMGNSSSPLPVDEWNRFDHRLLCSFPAMLALGSSSSPDETSKNDLDLARNLVRVCASMYEMSLTGLAGDTGEFLPDHAPPPDPSFYRRPEMLESLFVLYRLTKDNDIQDLAWKLFELLEKHCFNAEAGASCAELKDVNEPSRGHADMPFFPAATLKYFLLIFGPDDYVSLDDFVFTAEGHPMRKLGGDQGHGRPPVCVLQTNPPVPLPLPVLFLCVALCAAVSGCCYWFCTMLKLGVALLGLDNKSKRL